MSSVLEKTYEEFIAKKDIASFIKFFSVITWEKIGFVRRQDGLKFHEVTVTQNLLFQFRLLALAFSQSVKMFEAKDETANGNDIELYIKTRTGYIFLPCQAKIMYKNKKETYQSIDHLVTNKIKGISEQQIESLIRYASSKHRNIKGIPIYLFYNFSDNAIVRSAIMSSTKDDLEVYGCSYLDARKLRGKYYIGPKWSKCKPSFSELHPSIAKPFYTLFTHLNKPIEELENSDAFSEEIYEYVIDQRPELIDSNNWRAVTADLSSDQPAARSRKSQSTNENTEPGFNPKYKVVLGNSEIDSNLSKWLFM